MSESPLDAAKKLMNPKQIEAAEAPLAGPDVVVPEVKTFPVEDRKYVLGKSAKIDASEAGHQAAEILIKHGSRIRMAEIQYAPYLAPEIISSQGTVATGPDFPFHLAFIADDVERIGRAVSRGYAPLKVTDPRFADTLIIGEDALNMLIDRSPKMQRHYASQKVKPVNELPERLRDKWGFFIPPFVDESSKCIVWGNKQLWFCPIEIVRDRQAQIRKLNQNANVNKTDSNFLRDEVGGQIAERIRVDLD